MDMAYLSEKNIIEGRFIYYRKKTSKLINLPLQERAMMVLKRYKNNSQGYLFPILSKEHQIEQQKLNRLHKVITKANRALKAIGKELNISIKLTAYTTRHSYATSVCLVNGVSIENVAKMLGHSNIKMTMQGYSTVPF